MLRFLVFLAVIPPGGAYAQDQPDIFVRAFELASNQPSARVATVESAMLESRGLDEMVAAGLIRSPHDCLPEHRSWCFDVLIRKETEDLVAHEWGEWADGVSAQEMPEFVLHHMLEAASRGFNLFTDEELRNVIDN